MRQISGYRLAAVVASVLAIVAGLVLVVLLWQRFDVTPGGGLIWLGIKAVTAGKVVAKMVLVGAVVAALAVRAMAPRLRRIHRPDATADAPAPPGSVGPG
ncbi:MAG TPA: hypothetical protein VK453_29015 [Micromonosporaceae bacterium]|nr:hypothetical protein [Micromonosporaceae bacterium]